MRVDNSLMTSRATRCWKGAHGAIAACLLWDQTLQVVRNMSRGLRHCAQFRPYNFTICILMYTRTVRDIAAEPVRTHARIFLLEDTNFRGQFLLKEQPENTGNSTYTSKEIYFWSHHIKLGARSNKVSIGGHHIAPEPGARSIH